MGVQAQKARLNPDARRRDRGCKRSDRLRGDPAAGHSSRPTWPSRARPKLGGSRSGARWGRSPKPAAVRPPSRMKPVQEPAHRAWREAASGGRRRPKAPARRRARRSGESRGTERDRRPTSGSGEAGRESGRREPSRPNAWVARRLSSHGQPGGNPNSPDTQCWT